MTTRILVAYASRSGATADIAQKIGAVLTEAGFAAEVVAADDVANLESYDAVVLGSAVYAGQWRKEAVELLEKGEHRLASLPVWLFSSGPTGVGEPSTLVKGWAFPEAQRPLAERIAPREIVVFHGAIDMDRLNFAERLLIRGMKAPVGDFRDWDSIEGWAQRIAATLRQERVGLA